jgi:hypothetical protein
MFNKIRNGANSVKNHVKAHKGTYAASTVAIAAIALQQRNLRDFYAFLEEKGIDPLEFTCPEYFAEMAQTS